MENTIFNTFFFFECDHTVHKIILTEKHKQTLTQLRINMLKHTHVYAHNNNKMLSVCTSDHICTSTDIHTHTDAHSLTYCTPMLRALICGLCRGE